MDKRMTRFKLCDLRFYPILENVLERLPEEIREIVLNDRTFQILTDDEIVEAPVLRYEFGAPIRTLVYLNTKILKEPDHQIIHTVASEIAHYILRKQGSHGLAGKLDNLLGEWGFGKEVEAVRYDQAISESIGYKIGYDWAKKQNHSYLMQHFGLYFDQWNEKGIGRLSSKEFDLLKRECETDPVFDDILPSKGVLIMWKTLATLQKNLVWPIPISMTLGLIFYNDQGHHVKRFIQQPAAGSLGDFPRDGALSVDIIQTLPDWRFKKYK